VGRTRTQRSFKRTCPEQLGSLMKYVTQTSGPAPLSLYPYHLFPSSAYSSIPEDGSSNFLRNVVSGTFQEAVTMGTASRAAGCHSRTNCGYRGAWFDTHSVRTISLYCSSVNEPSGAQNRFHLHNACRPACSSGVQTGDGNGSGLYRSLKVQAAPSS
jgi:hypothetical protein